MELLLIWNGCPITSICGLPHRKLALAGDSLFSRRIRRKGSTLGSAFPSIPTQPVSRYRRKSIFASEQSAASVEGLGKDGDAVLVEVVGIGSRKDALLDFCLESPFFDSTSVRFWTMHMESGKVELHQKSIGKGLVQVSGEHLLSTRISSRALILVASSGYGSDIHSMISLLNSIKSLNFIVMGIILKPFSFEGKRRQSEVEDLVEKLRDHTNLCVVVETDALLKREAVTLAEAMVSANNAILMAIMTTSIIFMDSKPKFLLSSQDSFRELKYPELLDLLEVYGEAKVGYGAGYDIKTTIERAILECDFLKDGVIQELDGIIICTIASAAHLGKNDMHAFMKIFRQTSRCSTEILFSYILESNLDPGLLLTTIIIPNSVKQEPPKESFWSNLAHHIPFLFPFLGKTTPLQPGDYPSAQIIEKTSPSEEVSGPANGMTDLQRLKYESSMNVCGEYNISYCDEPSMEENSDEIFPLSKSDDPKAESRISYSQSDIDHHHIDCHLEGQPDAQVWDKKCQTTRKDGPFVDHVTTYSLPVGVKQFKKSFDDTQLYHPSMEHKTSYPMGEELLQSRSKRSWDALADAGIQAVVEAYNSASSLLNNKYDNGSGKQGSLSLRASYMLEAERDSKKKWSPTMEMKYRGGIYKGRCKGGFPEGKGRLMYADGSFYDGLWHHGKKSGLGSFYYINGDVFQGSWRDDLMHGKGWFYFHTGDRWFANFWKGKANGEGRFYSKDGSIYFCNFEDGWRHGQSIHIDVDGTRWMEIWDAGVLVSRELLDSATS
ncbi:protein ACCUMULATION AND REPLICATION OF CHLOROPLASTS 3, chloroplastic-like isoform X2 [Nymphaea colorata]|uniref:protein ACCUMULATION AND REPLICATION OF CHLOROPLASTS 3, chloroplastic-like isoform X2 n=1 Tax=Nymphaea colorata TaxID=210225 RepID=UPI00129E92C4|nr:protein ACCUMULATION AND REPLICATION OF CHLOROPLASTS 3, chloroplastic-like isoform X2 [Nymphaea colorata]